MRNSNMNNIRQELFASGLIVNAENGQLRYTNNFQALKLDYDLVFVRHGETFGNCGQVTSAGTIDYDMVVANSRDHEQRIFQGNVDTEINQLTANGKKQAQEVAITLKQSFVDKSWIPDAVLVSPLLRARHTAQPFLDNLGYQDKLIIHSGLTELSFGSWDNQRVCDLSESDPCHLFYKNQHALIKQAGEKANREDKPSESFCEVLIRARNVLMELNANYKGKKMVMFSHSMFGAACCILLGKGQIIENGDYLAFDGKRSDGTYYTMPNATPFVMNFDVNSLHLTARSTF